MLYRAVFTDIDIVAIGIDTMPWKILAVTDFLPLDYCLLHRYILTRIYTRHKVCPRFFDKWFVLRTGGNKNVITGHSFVVIRYMKMLCKLVLNATWIGQHQSFATGIPSAVVDRITATIDGQTRIKKASENMKKEAADVRLPLTNYYLPCKSNAISLQQPCA
jgi:hypothetical protein